MIITVTLLLDEMGDIASAKSHTLPPFGFFSGLNSSSRSSDILIVVQLLQDL